MDNKIYRNGIFFLVFLLAMGYILNNVGSLKNPFAQDGYELTVVLGNISGLEEGAAVRVAGVRVGEVQTITLRGTEAEVVVKIFPDIEVPEKTTATVEAMGLMGEKFMSLSPPDAADATGLNLSAGTTIRGEDPVSIDQLVGTLNAVGMDIKQVTGTLAEVFGSERAQMQLDNILTNIESVTENVDGAVSRSTNDVEVAVDNIREITEQIRLLVIENRRSVDNTVSNVEAVTAGLRTDVPAITDRLDSILAKLEAIVDDNRTNVDETLGNVADASGKLNSTLERIESIATKIDEGEGTIGALINDEETVDNVNNTLTSLQDTLDSAGEALGVVGRLRTDIGFRGEFQAESEEAKSFVTLRILPRQDKYYQVDLVSSPRGTRERKTIESIINSSVTGEEVITEERIVEEDELKFSVQIAKRFNNFTLRGGIIESEAGFGAEYDLLDGRMNLTGEAFDFGDDDFNVHVRLATSFFVTPNLYLTGGIDDPLNDEFDTVFFGGGFRYTDEDLKYLIGGAGALASF